MIQSKTLIQFLILWSRWSKTLFRKLQTWRM